MKHNLAGLGALAIGLCSGAHAQTSSTTSQGATAGAVGRGALAAGTTLAQAPESEASGVADIVVTAQKRSESLQKVPLAVTAVTQEELQKSGIRDVQGLASHVPNLTLGVNLGAAKVTMRGVGLDNLAAATEGSIALHIDGVFVSRPITALASFYDVERLEALRGPQGTLYGRNATGGSLNIITRQPTQDLSGYFNLTAGNYNLVTTEGALSGAIVPDVLAVRMAFQTQNRDGFGRNVVTGNDVDNLKTRAIRGTVLFTPNSRLTLNLSADYYRQRDNSGAFHSPGGGGFSAPGVPIIRFGEAQGGIIAHNLRDVAGEDDPINSLRFWGVRGKISYELTDIIEVSSLTSYRKTKLFGRTDLDNSSLALTKQFLTEDARQFSEELQVAGHADRLKWLLATYYFYENNDAAVADPLNPARTIFFGPNLLTTGFLAGGFLRTKAFAGFGQATYEIVDKLSFTVGARYSTEKKIDHDELAFDIFTPYVGAFATPQQTIDRSKRFNSFTPRVALDYQMTPDILLYASWSKGFKAGTYSLGAGTPAVNPEKVSAFEAGIKSQIFDRRVRFNLAGFYYDYKDLQVGKVAGNGNATLVLENAATATIYGLEAEFAAKVTPRFQIDGNAAWLHARFDKYVSADPARPFGDGRTIDNGNPAFDLHGNPLPQAPDFSVFAGAQYTAPSMVGDITLRGEVAWKDRYYFSPFKLSYMSQPAYTKVNLFLNWTSKNGHWNGSVFVKNLTNKLVIANMNVSSSVVGSPLTGYLEDPRTYGVTVGYRF